MIEPLSLIASALTLLEGRANLPRLWSQLKRRGNVIIGLRNEITDFGVIEYQLRQYYVVGGK
jgi:hypothetical protein